ncbi:MAG TPA: hypothetical protein VFX73_01850 [Chitinophagaceae bacterium]|nr:hypothetical protein [Chitinophagaceae bacterium]
MRILLLFIVLLSFTSSRAQTPLYPGVMNYAQRNPLSYVDPVIDSNLTKKKWSLHKYSGISASYSFFNGGSASIFSVPLGLQLNRQLNNNLYAFAGISAAPSYINFNRSFINADIRKYNTNNLALYSRFEAGLMYVNDERTFSISGSIGVERNSYPVYPYYNRTGLPKQQPVNGPLK